MYFGRDHNYPSNYTYQPHLITDPFPSGSLRSPLFNITQVNENFTQVFAKFGLRTSINSGDFMYLQINPNWTGWITLKAYTNEERDWFLEEINITQYIGNYVQFRFLTLLDDEFDPINYKGLMLDYFSLENHTNLFSPEIDFVLEENLLVTQGFKYDSFTFSCRYYDSDGNYPDFLYLEIDNNNYSMINIFGDWNVSSNSTGNRGVLFVKSLVIGDLSDLSFKFHVFDGKFQNSTIYYNQDNSIFSFQNPDVFEFNIDQNDKMIGYEFASESLSEYYVVGDPIQKELTSWLRGDNTWHITSRFTQSYLYGGLGQSFGSLNQGYETNWDIKLITHPLHLRSEYKVYLKYYFDISLQNEFFLELDELDKCTVSISKNFGESWVILKEYFFDSEILSGNESLDISQFSDEDVIIMFTLSTNDITTGLGHGWLLSNIYIGYDKSTDFVTPNIEILSPSNDELVSGIFTLEANISDDVELDNSRIYIYINNQMVDRTLLDYDQATGVLTFQWDTTLYKDGSYDIKVVSFDKEGNRGESSISVVVENGFIDLRTWGVWLIIIVSFLTIGVISYFIAEKRGKVWIKNRKNSNAENIRLKYIDKDQIIKRIELIETKDEQQRPLILHCKYCRSWFESNKFNYICPVCEHDQIYVAYNCMNCGKWYFKDEPSDDYYCKNKKCQGVRLIKREKEEIKDILNQEGKLLRKYEYKSKRFSILGP